MYNYLIVCLIIYCLYRATRDRLDRIWFGFVHRSRPEQLTTLCPPPGFAVVTVAHNKFVGKVMKLLHIQHDPLGKKILMPRNQVDDMILKQGIEFRERERQHFAQVMKELNERRANGELLEYFE